MSDIHLRPTARPISYDIIEDVLDEADILSAETAPTPIAEQILAIASETLIIDGDSVEDDDEPAMVAQASLPPPPMTVPEWDALMFAPPPRRVRFRRGLVASCAGAFLGGILLASAAVDRVAATDVPAFESMTVQSTMSIAPGAQVTMPTIVIPVGEALPMPATTAKVKVKAPSLADADRALRARDFAGAESGYQAMLARGGADHEALTGLGMIAAAQHRTTDAMAFFDRALALNAGYLPARLGLADALWDAGRNDTAVAQYREIRVRFANDVYPTRVIERSR